MYNFYRFKLNGEGKMAKVARMVEAENFKDVIDLYVQEKGSLLSMKDIQKIFKQTIEY